MKNVTVDLDSVLRGELHRLVLAHVVKDGDELRKGQAGERLNRGVGWKAMVFRSFERNSRLDCVKRLIADGCWGVAPYCIFTEISFNFFVVFRTCV